MGPLAAVFNALHHMTGTNTASGSESSNTHLSTFSSTTAHTP